MDVLILTGLILLNGVFAMSEIALVTARKNRLEKLANNGDKGAASALTLGKEPTRFLSTVQIGITAIGLLNGIFGEAALAAPLADYLQQLGVSEKVSSVSATTIVVVSITYLSIVVGELVPKRLAQLNPENVACLISRPLSVLASLSRPFVLLLAASTECLLSLVSRRHSNEQSDAFTEDDIKAILAESTQSGVIEKHEHAMVKNVFHFDDRKVTSFMTPRSEIIAMDLNKPIESNLNYLAAASHQHFPVIQGNIDAPKGVITTKLLLQYHLARPRNPIEHYLLPPVYIPENWTGCQLLAHFRESGDNMVFVVDEYGDIQGIVTPKDLLEALTGEFKTRAPEDVWSLEQDDGSWLMDGLIPISVMKDLLEIDTLPDESQHGYHTLSGMLMWCLSRLPAVGDSYEWEGWYFEVAKIEGNRADKITVTPLPSISTVA
ncbi:HlyC/CorC family transporter [Photobacterium sanctipauli]|uniref:HlyC/CorC family transporter n=1 Tax=Photobacterium sanctipauli TaxID=1342794 RepID=A0A2T3NBP4_9GAMM|nr:hemolysin family protein [Photobacterium sanctipauli]PSW11364.1 HlyC/CorC family transporter [Photobacterium sanctipauli]